MAQPPGQAEAAPPGVAGGRGDGRGASGLASASASTDVRRRVAGVHPVLAAAAAGLVAGVVVAVLAPGARGALALAPIAAGAAIDIRTRRIPNPVTAGTLVFALVAAVPGGLPAAALGALVAGAAGVLLAVGARGAFGAGDIKLMAASGAAVGVRATPLLLASMALAGGLIALAIVAARRGRIDGTMAYGPAIAIGAAVAVLGG